MVAVSYCRSFSLLLVFLGLATALPSGAPPQACVSLVPGHGAVPIDPALRPPPYFIVSDLLMKNGSLVYEPDETYNISLISVLGATFRGFIVQARDVNGSVIGMMDTSGSNGQARLADCPDSNNSTVTHVNNYDKSSVSFQWTAPSGFDDIVELRYSVVIMFASYYVNLNAADFPVDCNITLTDVGTHPLIFRMPENCPRQECEYFVGLGVNPSDPTYLDVYLEGNAAGWIAIGFSLNKQMEDDDVLGCRVNSGAVTVVDTWNPSPRQAPNMLDATQDGLCVQSTSFINGRITCSFSRLINGTDISQDYDLDNLFYLLYGRRAADQGLRTSLGYHSASGGMTPSISPILYNPVNDSNTDGRCPVEVTSIESHNLIFGMPEGCLRADCEYYVGLSPNPSDPTYLDVYLEGNAAGWIAIGFSNNTQMEDDDVLGCRVNSSIVTVVDTWNPSPRRTANMLDATQDGLCVQSTSFTNGRITCRFSRTINITDVGQDYNLDDSYYLLFGRRAADQGVTTVLGYHSANGGMTPAISEQQYNPVVDNNANNRCPDQATAVGSHNLLFGMPQGCERSACEYYVGLSPNPSDPTYLDVYLEGNAAGWIAVGFSLNTQMENDDVLGCRVNSGAVTVVDTWNPSSRRAPNVLDATQDGLCVQSTSFTNNRITCRFSRTINITDVGQDYNLNSSYYLLFGRRAADQGVTTVLGYHSANGGMTPAISEQQYNPVVDNNANNRCPDQATAVGSHNLLFGMPQGCPTTALGYHTVNGGMTPAISEQQFNPVRDRNTGGCPPVPPTEDLVYTFQQGTQGSGYYFGARINRTNPLYLDMRLEASASGWVGVGFSVDNRMGVDDVLACQRDPNSNMVTAVDTWNPGPAREPNQIDPGQIDICPYTGSFENGRIICTFSRLINTGDTNNDLDLGMALFQLYGTSDSGGLSSLAQHGETPAVTAEAIVVTNATGAPTDDFPRRELTRVHGILMIVAWPLLVVSAIFFALWMKPALPNGEWFQIHRAFMIVSLFLTALGFIFIFVANAKNPGAPSPGLISFACGKSTGHFVIGIIVFFLQIMNPIIAIFRCKPTGSYRWIFNLIHGTAIGFLAEILALVNVGLGIALFESGCGGTNSFTLLWVYIVFVILLVIIQLVMTIVFTVMAFRAPPEKRAALGPTFLKYYFQRSAKSSFSPPQKDMEMTEKGKAASNDPPPKKKPSEDSPFRWGGFGVFIIITFVLVVVMAIMVAVI
uniref:DOMON domain-containing protein n=1 Tax=Amphimedon queenslandica TaxID=400682 RepID=A0A1X7UY64_AMPQE